MSRPGWHPTSAFLPRLTRLVQYRSELAIVITVGAGLAVEAAARHLRVAPGAPPAAFAAPAEGPRRLPTIDMPSARRAPSAPASPAGH